MFTFVIWAIGLAIMGGMAVANIGITVAAFESHWLLGVLCLIVSFIGWMVLLALVF